MTMHGNKRNAILRHWRHGYRLRAIAREFGIGISEEARIIAGSGVSWSSIAVREREESK